jgi:hypothetical protein
MFKFSGKIDTDTQDFRKLKYNLALKHHVGTFNISATAKKSKYRAKLLKGTGKINEGYIELYEPAKGKWFKRNPRKVHKVFRGIEGNRDNSKDYTGPAVLFKEQIKRGTNNV